jgi:hypothetical protein
MTEDVRVWVHRYADDFNKTQDVDVLDKYIAKDYLWHLPGKNIVGLEALKKEFKIGMPKQLVPEDIAVDGNIVVIRWSFVRTNSKTGEVRKTSGITFDYVKDGRFAEGWEVGSGEPWG